jgi:hypothetical protein
MESQQIPKVQHSVVDVQINNNNNKKNKNKKLKFPKFGCFRIQHDAKGDGFDIEVVDRSNPTHLIIMVNGLIGRFVLLIQYEF